MECCEKLETKYHFSSVFNGQINHEIVNMLVLLCFHALIGKSISKYVTYVLMYKVPKSTFIIFKITFFIGNENILCDI